MKYSLLFIFILSVTTSCQNLPKQASGFKAEKSLHPYPVLQGMTTDTATVISVLTKGNEDIGFQIISGEDLVHNNMNHKKIKAGGSGYAVHHVTLKELKPDSHYTFQIIKKDRVLDQRTFGTAKLTKSEAKFGVVSCTSDKFPAEQFQMWSDYLNHDLDYTFMIGDNVYADYPKSKKRYIQNKAEAHSVMMWRRYIETWSNLLFYRSSHLIPTMALWDDHDYGTNDGNRRFRFKAKSLEIFRTFYPILEAPEITPMEGVGYIFEAYDQRFVFIDARSFRSPKSKKKKLDSETQWGVKQTEMIIDVLKTPKPTWLIQGDQFFGAYHRFESFEGDRPRDFKNTLAKIKSSPSKVFFVSGDRHLTEFMKIEKNILGYETYEMTSSAMHANVYPDAWKTKPNPRQMHGQSGILNYSIVSSKIGEIWDVKVEAFGPQMQLLYDVDVKLDNKKIK